MVKICCCHLRKHYTNTQRDCSRHSRTLPKWCSLAPAPRLSREAADPYPCVRRLRMSEHGLQSLLSAWSLFLSTCPTRKANPFPSPKRLSILLFFSWRKDSFRVCDKVLTCRLLGNVVTCLPPASPWMRTIHSAMSAMWIPGRLALLALLPVCFLLHTRPLTSERAAAVGAWCVCLI